MPGLDPSNRHPKRSRKSDAIEEKKMHTERERTKRRRTSGDREILDIQRGKDSGLIATDPIGEESAASSEPWSLSSSVGGRFTHIDPLLTPDEQYLIVGVDNGVNVYSASTSRLFRTLKLNTHHRVVGYNLHSTTKERLYIFTADGTVSEWDWSTAMQVARWEVGKKTISAELSSRDSGTDAPISVLSLRRRKDGIKEVVLTYLDVESSESSVILETELPVEHVKSSGSSGVVIAYGGHYILLGVTSSTPDRVQYSWREMALPVDITCLDIRCIPQPSQARGQHATRPLETVDIVLGEPGGSMLVYYDILSLFMVGSGGEGEKTLNPRRLHWHRDPVSAVRWSRDGNYVISGGHETVLVLWQLDTGRKQFLPHLSAQICSIVVSDNGSSYVLKLADNSLMVLSARELQPFATITGLQLCPKNPTAAVDGSKARISPASSAVLHPRYPDHLLVPVPVRQHTSSEGVSSADFCVLQTYDIRTDSHVSRQALARTNATTLRVGPEGSRIDTPDVTLLDVAHDGKWMATVDSWTPHQQDIGVLDSSNHGSVKRAMEGSEIFLKFWKWSNATKLWELVSRIDGPHFTETGPVTVLDLASRPQAHEFATVGLDAVLRFWCPTVRQRSGLKQENAEPLESWRCRNTIDLAGYIGTEESSLSAASLSYSQDGSVLALCLQKEASEDPGFTILIDVQNGSIRYSRVGLYPGRLCGAEFLGCHLVIATHKSVSIWDTVGDSVRTTGISEIGDTSSNTQLLAVNSRTQTFAVATQSSRASGKPSKSQTQIRVYDINTLSQIFKHRLSQPPLALLSGPHSGDYVVVDAGANVRRIGCQQKVPHIAQPQEIAYRLDSGLTSLFGSQSGADWNKNLLESATKPGTDASATGQLANVFREAPFVAPPTSILFRDVVKVLSA
ncbi:hypothetical protein BDV59DRAFT_43998 [Aspergillus ambiguus]|uniref:WD repeat protein n=1 Tax=Aspergillus ambiguus TaxID=176160 RepID=UPI003CCDEB1D